MINDLSIYATKTDLKYVTHIDTLDIEKLVPVPVDLSKLNNVVKNEGVKKTVYDKSVAKVNNIDTSGFALKTKYDADKPELEKNILDTGKLAKKSDYNAKISEFENKIPSISGLVTTSTLTAVENKISSVINLVKKTDYDTRICELENKLTGQRHEKYISTAECNKLTVENFRTRLAQANLIRKTDFDAKLSSIGRKITSNKINHLLVENQLNRLETFDSI